MAEAQSTSDEVVAESQVRRIKLISWNVNGLQGILKKSYPDKIVSGETPAAKSLLKKRNLSTSELPSLAGKSPLETLLENEKPDILCLQEIRCSALFEWKPLPYTFASHCDRKTGYSGTLVTTSLKPLNVSYGMEGITDTEGRIITVEFEDFILVNEYVPNTGSGSTRMAFRLETWEPALRRHIATLQSRGFGSSTHPERKGETQPSSEGKNGKGVIVVGDMNVAPTDLDVTIRRQIAGTTEGERNAFFQLLREQHLVDSFRAKHPRERKSSWVTSYGTGARLDFILIPSSWVAVTQIADILNYPGSDHRPIVLVLEYSVPT